MAPAIIPFLALYRVFAGAVSSYCRRSGSIVSPGGARRLVCKVACLGPEKRPGQQLQVDAVSRTGLRDGDSQMMELEVEAGLVVSHGCVAATDTATVTVAVLLKRKLSGSGSGCLEMGTD
ncbi:hypothetical protein HDK77DRAFT_451640 [Phyllosticta capitalensis]